MNAETNSTHTNILINEEAFHTGFDNIQGGDMFVIITDKHTFNGKVVDKYSNQIVTQIDGKNILFTNNSLDDDKITGFEIIDGKKVAKTVVGVNQVIIRRNGNTVTTLTSKEATKDKNNSDKFDRFGNEEPEMGPNIREIYNDIDKALNSVAIDNKLIITTGTITNETEINYEPVATIEIHVRKIHNNDIIIGAVTDMYGDEVGKYKSLNDGFIKISKSESLEMTDNGVVLMVKTTDNKIHFIETIIDMEIGEYFNVKEPTFDDMMQDKGFRDLMLKQPNLASRVAGEMAKGVVPANDILKNLGLNHDYFTRGKKVKFTYTGQQVRPGKQLSLNSGKEYIGIFSTSRSIKLTGTKRGESLLIKLKKKTHEQIYEVEVTFNRINNGQQTSDMVGRGLVQITDINFR